MQSLSLFQELDVNTGEKHSDHSTLIQNCLNQSRHLLRSNMDPHGILAATRSPEAERRRYTRIFGRDASICALGMAVSDDENLQKGGWTGLLTLAEHQAENGQIPKYVDPRGKEVDYWYIGCIDATLWWLIAVRFYAQQFPDQNYDSVLARNIEKAIVWLQCQEHQRLFLLQQNEASDWADIMPRSGYVLYSNALWYYVKRLYDLPHRQETKFHFNHLFFPFSRNMPDYRRLRLLTEYVCKSDVRRDLYLSFVNFSFWGDEGDVFGNLLALLMGLADKTPAEHILKALADTRVNLPYPVRATCTPIKEQSYLWRDYMARHRQNLDYQYHNGGIWPFIGGFWVLALHAAGKHEAAQNELVNLAKVNQLAEWGFYEWFHGQSGEPNGMRGQSWNAAMFLLAHHALTNKVF